MTRGSMFRKCMSLALVIAILTSIAAPALATSGWSFNKEDAAYYVALGDGMTYGEGLAEGELSYVERVAEALGAEDDWYAHANSRYRVEELRYLLDRNYKGDGYTKSIGGLSQLRNDVQGYVANAEVITINIGVNNFSTYIIEQMMYYLENDGAVKYSYSFDEFADADVQDAMENVKGIVMEQLKAAANEEGATALEMIDYVVDVSTYAMLSYIASFNGMIEAIHALNPDVDLYVVGLYNPAEGEKLSISYHGKEETIPVGDVFGALTEMANAYVQILANRNYGYVYVDAGSPKLLIDQLGDTSMPNDVRVPGALKLELLDAAEDTAVSLVIEMFETYGITKTYKQALAIVEEIFGAANDAAREDYIRNLLSGMVVDEVLARFETELENYAGTYGDIDVQREDIVLLLEDLDNAKTVAQREGVAEEFVVDLMTKAMVGQTFAGMEIKTQDDAYAAIELLERNSNGEPEALREAAADMIMVKVGENGLKSYIERDDVLDLLEQLDTTTTTVQRRVIIANWMNGLAAKKIVEKIDDVNPAYTIDNAMSLLAAMEANPANAEAIAKTHLLTTGGFHDYMVIKFTETYRSNGLTLQTYPSFDAFVTAVEAAEDNVAAKAIVRQEIRAAAAQKVVSDAMYQQFLSSVGVADVIVLFASLDTSNNIDQDIIDWICEKKNWGTPNATQLEVIVLPIKAVFLSAYNAYNDAATVAEEAFTTYRDGVAEASEAFAQYNNLKDDAAEQILSAYEESYKGAGETALGYYNDYLLLKKSAVEKVMSGYVDYQNAIAKGMESCDQLNEKFDTVFDLLCEIGEVDTISLNNLVSVAKKIEANGNYVNEMVENLIQGDKLASEDKTVAYIALRYYLAGSMMIMPSADGHAQIANNIVKGIRTGKDVSSTAGYWANLVIDKTINLYNSTNAFFSKDATASGQAGVLINPDLYVALGGNITTGSALSGSELTYVELLGNALAMDYNDLGNYDNDQVLNYALNGLRAEDLYALVSGTYAGDAYTADRFGEDFILALGEDYRTNIKNADLITIEVGINNLVTYPMMQALLAYNGEDTYEMDWGHYIGDARANKISKGKDAMCGLLLGIANHDAQCETALNTVVTAVESMLYGMIGYIFHLDNAVESIATQNPDATIVLVGFYNPLNDTYINIDREVEVAGKSVDLSKYTVNISAIADKIINIGNRYLANYVGNTAANGNANDKDSRLLNVSILNAELCISDSNVSKDLSTLVKKNITVNGKNIPLLIPAYFAEAGKTGGEALHPNAVGHLYIRNQILKALNYQILADVYPEHNWKYYGDVDPELYYYMDDESSLYNIVVNLIREQGEDIGLYEITATVIDGSGYAEIDVFGGVFEIVARPLSVDVEVIDGVIASVTVTGGSMAPSEAIDDLNLTMNADGTEVICNNANYNVSINAEFKTTSDPIVEGVISIKTNSLNLESEVHYNVKYEISGFDMDQVVEIGLLEFYTRTDDVNDSTYFTANNIYEWDQENGLKEGARYVSRTAGIPAAELGENRWYRAYVKLCDGTYRYSNRTVYSAVKYSQRVFDGDYGNNLKALCVSLMDYGAAAQVYFAEQGIYEYDTPMNAFLYEAPYNQYRNLVQTYNDDMIDQRLPARTSPYGEFDNRSNDIKTGSYSLTLLGAISLNAKNYSYTYQPENVVESGFIFWNHDTFSAGNTLTWENAALVVKCSDNDGSIEATLPGIAAAEMHETFVGVAYVKIGDAYYYGAVSRISVDHYAESIINDTDYSASMRNLAKYMVVYGEYAQAYFET